MFAKISAAFKDDDVNTARFGEVLDKYTHLAPSDKDLKHMSAIVVVDMLRAMCEISHGDNEGAGAGYGLWWGGCGIGGGGCGVVV